MLDLLHLEVRQLEKVAAADAVPGRELVHDALAKVERCKDGLQPPPLQAVFDLRRVPWVSTLRPPEEATMARTSACSSRGASFTMPPAAASSSARGNCGHARAG